MFFMIILFFMLGKFFMGVAIIRDLSYLFFGIVFGLGFIYILFITKTKTSLHLLSIGAAIGYFLLFQQLHNTYILPVIIIFMLLSGLLAS